MDQYIFVGGMDYEFSGVDFRIFCDNRLKRIQAANTAKKDLKFQIFDVRRGEVVVNETTYPKGVKTEKVTKTKPFDALSRANFNAAATPSGGTHYTFKERQDKAMSILDIYDAVQKVGTGDPGTLRELSIFSHAWMGGPILVNSYDDRTGHFDVPMPMGLPPVTMPYTVAGTARDPDDKDPRAQYDFIPPTMDAAALVNFQKAFHPDGIIWIWGCGFPRLVHEILHKIEHNSVYKKAGLGDAVEFTFTNLSNDHIDLLEKVLKPLIGAFPDRKKVVVKFKFLKYFFCVVTTSSYSHQLARNSKVKVFGAVMGTYAEYDTTGPLPLMSIFNGFGAHFDFYENYLGFKYDAEGRHYGAYEPGFSCAKPSVP